MELKSAAPNNSTKAEYSIAKFRSHGALNQAVKQGLSAKIRFAKANMKLRQRRTMETKSAATNNRTSTVHSSA